MEVAGHDEPRPRDAGRSGGGRVGRAGSLRPTRSWSSRSADARPRHAQRHRGALSWPYELWNLQYADAHRQGGGRLLDHPRPRRVVGGDRRRADVHVHAARRTEVVRRRAAHRRGRRVHDQPRARRRLVQPPRSPRTSPPTAIDDRTVEISRSVPDPKLPMMDVYIVPKHIYEKYGTTRCAYDALDGVGSGPFVLDEWKKGSRGRWSPTRTTGRASAGHRRGRVPVFSNPEAMVDALENGRDRRRPLACRRRRSSSSSNSDGIDAVEGHRAASTSSRSTAAGRSREVTRR